MTARFALELLDIHCSFAASAGGGPSYTAVADTTLRVAAGEFVSVVGPTGCGKSTLLNVGAGLLAPTRGEVRVFGEALQGLNRRAGYMFQAEALLPWRSALENVMLGLQYRGVSDAQAQDWRRTGWRAWAWPALGTAIRTNSRGACASARRWHRPWRWTRTSF